MRPDGIEQRVVGQLGIGQPEFLIRRILLPPGVSKRQAGSRYQLDDAFAGGWRLEIFDNGRLDARLPDHGEGVPGGAAVGIVVDGDGHVRSSGLIGNWLPADTRSSQDISASATSAPAIWARMKPGRSMARIPEKVSVNERAIATAGLANDVDAENQYAAVM